MQTPQFLSAFLFLLIQLAQTAPRPQDVKTTVPSDKKKDPVVIVLRPSDLIPKIELPNLEVPDVGAVLADGFPMLPPGFGKVEIPRVDLGIFGRAAQDGDGDDCGIICQMLQTVDQQLGVVHRQIADINRRISKWEEGTLEEELEEDLEEKLEEELEEKLVEELDEDLEEELEDDTDDGVEEDETLLELGDGGILTEDWTNSTVDEEVLVDGSVVEVNRTTVYDKDEEGKGFSFVHSVRKTKKGGGEHPKKDDVMEDEVPEEDLGELEKEEEKEVEMVEEEEEVVEEDEEDLKEDGDTKHVEGDEQNEIFSKRK